MNPPFGKVLIANRGAIACRIIRTLRRMGIGSVAVYSDADASSLHVTHADEAVRLGGGAASESYLNIEKILAAAKASGAWAIHPGYGFLSENAGFAEACEAAGVAFIGPTPDNMRAFGLKHTARDLAKAFGAPLAPGTDLLTGAKAALDAAEEIGFPVILKATAGGGGIGMRVCENPESVRDAFAAVERLAAGNFGDDGVFLERYVRQARHVEVQVFGDGAGHVIALGERDCSLQRRNQKVIEETPAPLLPDATRAALLDASVRLMQGAQYRSAGTVEYLYDAERDDFFFLEVNTRLQVEHGVTEQVTGIDLVEWMVRGAAGDYAFMTEPRPAPKGASMQARLYAEDPARDFRPSSGAIIEAHFPEDARVDSWIMGGSEVSAFYDPLLAKLIVTAPDRPQAVIALQSALDATRIAGIETNVDWLRTVARSPAFTSGNVSTRALSDIPYAPRALEVISGGPATTIQDYPGRVGYWDVGVPPSGPMDALSFRLGNRLLGNEDGAAGLEMTGMGPALRFHHDALFCLTGADFGAMLDGAPIPAYAPTLAKAGQTLRLGRIKGGGLRGYMLFQGGLDAPIYLGSRSCFTLGHFGGHAGRAIAAGDMLHLATGSVDMARTQIIAQDQRPAISKTWRIEVRRGPHGAPDFFTPEDIDAFLSAEWKVHYNSNRTGVRLIGPKPHWARRDGGEAGLHPSNIHDNAYVIGALDFTGDMPIILGPDGPSLGGFVCPFAITQGDLWKIGQIAPGDSIHFVPVDEADAIDAETAQEALVKTLFCAALNAPAPSLETPILAEIPESAGRPRTIYRRQGDHGILIEYGPIVLDLELRLRVHALLLEMRKMALPGVVDLTPGIRSLQVHYDSRVLASKKLLTALIDAEDRLGGLDDFEIASRIVHLPLSWKDPAIYQTIKKYMASVRDDAPWCPDNIEFIRRINGLESIDDVRRIVFDADYLVMGLGDVYLGAPVAVPVDPRHRLVTTKYNPARTWTPPNVVGIGGAYMCIYGMEGPGGYQLFGRTIQVWNTYRQTRAFTEGKPWLLRFFDRIKFFPVSHEELTEWRRDFPLGRRDIKIEDGTFRLSEYRAFLQTHKDSIAAFQSTRQGAFDAERADWDRRGEFDRVAALSADTESGVEAPEIQIPDGCEIVEAPLGGNMWRVDVTEGALIAQDQVIAVIEAMKTECDVLTHTAGIVRKVYAQKGQQVTPGAPIAAIEPTS